MLQSVILLPRSQTLDCTGKTWCQFHQYFMSSFFCMKVFCVAFMCLQFGFVIFWRKGFGAKAAHKMSVKLTPARNQHFSFLLTFVNYVRKKSLINWAQMWLEGDNKARSLDSRVFGPVSIGLLEGLVFCRIWPFKTYLRKSS